MSAGAKAMNLSTAEFIKLVETGKLLAKDFMLPFARQLRMMVRENDALTKATEKLTARQQRLTTAFKDLIDQTFQGGVAESIGRMFDLITRFVRFITPATKTLLIAIGEIAHITSEAVGAIFELVGAITTLSSDSPTLITRAWSGVKAFFHTLAAAVWSVIGAVQFLTETIKGDINLEQFQAAGESFANAVSPMGIAESVYSGVRNLFSGNGGGVSVQGDVVIKHDGSQSITDNLMSELGFN